MKVCLRSTEGLDKRVIKANACWEIGGSKACDKQELWQRC